MILSFEYTLSTKNIAARITWMNLNNLTMQSEAFVKEYITARIPKVEWE